MTRKSIAQKILEELESLQDEETPHILIYGFNPKEGKIHIAFYDNVKRIFNALEDGLILQRGVIKCDRYKTAQALKMLAEHYGAKVLLFKVKELK